MLSINLKGKIAFIAGVGDDQGYGWAIAKTLAEAGATILIGTWTPMLKIFTMALEAGKFDESRKLSDGSLMQIEKVYPLDAMFDGQDVPGEILENKRYKDVGGYTVSEVARTVAKDYEHIDILIHSLANGPEVQKPLLETSRKGYVAAVSASSYSFISLLQHFGPIMRAGSSNISHIPGSRGGGAGIWRGHELG